jgi:hypothetical protein
MEIPTIIEEYRAWDATQEAQLVDASEADNEAFVDAAIQRFGAMWEQLTPDERLAESTRLAHAVADQPGKTTAEWLAERQSAGTRTEQSDTDWERQRAEMAATSWTSLVGAWCSHRASELLKQEHVAEELAERAFARCTYLGGHPNFPRPATGCDASVLVGEWIQFGPPAGGRVDLEVRWSELTGLEVRPTDRAGERVTATRVAFLGLFAWAAKKQRREAVLAVHTTCGDAVLIVKGLSPVELEASLSPLSHCIGRPSSRDYSCWQNETDDVIRAAKASQPPPG